MNEYDSSKIMDILRKSHDFTFTEKIQLADLIVLNTCSIRKKATDKVYSELGRLKSLKKQKKELIIALGGCVSIEEKQSIFRRAPHVDIVFGPQTLHRLPQLYNQALKNEKKLIDVSSETLEKFDFPMKPSQSLASNYISIMEGCNKFCSYCIVPYTRGAEISRKAIDILGELKLLIDQGLKEIHLLGQNVNNYRDPTNGARLAALLEKIANFKEIERIRFTTSHPVEFSEDLIAAFKNIKKLANHVHLPLQSGSNRILQLMHRGYSCEEYKKIIHELRCARPSISISTDFIVGFPGETQEDFSATLNAAKDINFDASFSFIYSARPGTTAAKLQDNVTLEEKKERLAILQTQLAKQSHNYARAMVGSVQEVLVTSHAKKNSDFFSGRSSNNRIVNFSAPKNVLNTMTKVKITDVFSNSLGGTAELI